MPGVHHQSDSSTAPSTVFQGINWKPSHNDWIFFTQVQNDMLGWQHGDLYSVPIDTSPPLFQPILSKWKLTTPIPEAYIKAM